MRAIVHIGLPRCASRTLQTGYFPVVAAENDGFVYAGPIRPRPRRVSPLYRAFCESLYEEGSEHRLRKVLEGSGSRTALFSDMMMVVEPPGMTWQTKLARLSRAIAGTDYTILIGLRDPAEAAVSSYADIYHRLPGPRRSVLKAAASPGFEIFQYRRVFRTIFDLFDEDRVATFSHADVVAGRLDALDAALGVPARDRVLPRLGQRHTDEAGIRTGRLSLEQTIAYGLPRRLGHAVRPLVERLRMTLRDAKVGPSLLVPYPSAAEIERLIGFYAPHADFLRDRFGIDDGPSSRSRPHLTERGSPRTRLAYRRDEAHASRRAGRRGPQISGPGLASLASP